LVIKCIVPCIEGVGGFAVNKRKVNRKPTGEGGSLEGAEKGPPGPADAEDSMPMPGPPMEEDKQKKWARKNIPGRRRSVLQESFPSYMQVRTSFLSTL